MITLPNSDIRTLAPLNELDYYDSQSVTLNNSVTPLEAWNLIMADPQPLLQLAFRIRDAVSTRFGVKRIGGFSGPAEGAVSVGDHLDFFLIEHKDDNVKPCVDRELAYDQGRSCLVTILDDLHQVGPFQMWGFRQRFGFRPASC